MRQKVLIAFLGLFAGVASAQTSITPGASSITSGGTSTSGCVAGGVLRSISNLVDCSAGLTYASSVMALGTGYQAAVTNAYKVGSASASSTFLAGQSDTRYVALSWIYNATAGSASGGIATAGYLNPFNIDASAVIINGASGGATTIGGSGITGTTVAATINNGTSTGNILNLQDNGSNTAYFPNGGGFVLVTGSKPTCDSSVRGMTFYVAGGAGVADTYEVCRKDAADAYAWVSIF